MDKEAGQIKNLFMAFFDFKKAFEYENNFYWTSAPSRVGKCVAHYELFKMAGDVEGDIVECGVFKGASLLRFASFQDIFGKRKRSVIGFDTFGAFPDTSFAPDEKHRQRFIDDAGVKAISKEDLLSVARRKGIKTKIELIKGDVVKTVPAYIAARPKLKIALLNLDTDIYEPAVTVLKYLYPKISKGGILITDDYKVFPGETKAIDDFFRGKNVYIQSFPNLQTPHFIIKK